MPQNINFGIKTTVARDFLDAAAIDYETAASVAELSAAEVAAQTTRNTRVVECWQCDPVPPPQGMGHRHPPRPRPPGECVMDFL